MVLLPAGKVFSLALRLFTKPLVTVAKSQFKRKTEHPRRIQRGFIAVGQFQHRLNTRIANLADKSNEVRVLTDDRAFDGGAEFVAEALVYGVLLTWGVYEIFKVQAENRAKDETIKCLVQTIEMRIQEEIARQRNLHSQLNELKRVLH